MSVPDRAKDPCLQLHSWPSSTFEFHTQDKMAIARDFGPIRTIPSILSRTLIKSAGPLIPDHGETRGRIFDQLARQNVFVNGDVQEELLAQLSLVVILMQRYPEERRTEAQTEELVNAIRMLTVQYPEYQWQWPENKIGNLPKE